MAVTTTHVGPFSLPRFSSASPSLHCSERRKTMHYKNGGKERKRAAAAARSAEGRARGLSESQIASLCTVLSSFGVFLARNGRHGARCRRVPCGRWGSEAQPRRGPNEGEKGRRRKLRCLASPKRLSFSPLCVTAVALLLPHALRSEAVACPLTSFPPLCRALAMRPLPHTCCWLLAPQLGGAGASSPPVMLGPVLDISAGALSHHSSVPLYAALCAPPSTAYKEPHA